MQQCTFGGDLAVLFCKTCLHHHRPKAYLHLYSADWALACMPSSKSSTLQAVLRASGQSSRASAEGLVSMRQASLSGVTANIAPMPDACSCSLEPGLFTMALTSPPLGETLEGRLHPHEGAASFVVKEPMMSMTQKASLQRPNKGSAACNKGNAALNKDDKEAWRRERISRANKGKVPWNKGMQLSEETKQRISRRTFEAMQNPQIRAKIRHHRRVATTLSPETRAKIRKTLLNTLNAKKERRLIQATCIIEWKELIADASRKGYKGDLVYQWNSYTTISNQLRAAWRDKEKLSLSFEHKAHISQAIKAKWADPEYRNMRRKRRKAYWMSASLPSQGRQAEVLEKTTISGHDPLKGEVHTQQEEKRSTVTRRDSETKSSKLPAFKDHSTQKKLEKLKQIRSKRLIERARVLMEDAKVAARALEKLAVKDKNMLGPLFETRRLLAEAAVEMAGLRVPHSISLSDSERLAC